MQKCCDCDVFKQTPEIDGNNARVAQLVRALVL